MISHVICQLLQTLEDYSGKPCVYVRWVNGRFYIGRATNLLQRYSHRIERQQLICFEEWNTVAETIARETMLIKDFKQAGLPVANTSDGRMPDTLADTPAFRQCVEDGMSRTDLAKRFGVSESTIARAKRKLQR